MFLLVSHGNPEERLHFLEQYDIDGKEQGILNSVNEENEGVMFLHI